MIWAPEYTLWFVFRGYGITTGGGSGSINISSDTFSAFYKHNAKHFM